MFLISTGNLFSSKTGSIERQKLDTNVGHTSIALGVVYVHANNDVYPFENASDLHYEFMENISALQQSYDKVSFIVKINGKVTKYKTIGKTLSSKLFNW